MCALPLNSEALKQKTTSTKGGFLLDKCGEDRTAIEHSTGLSTAEFLQQLAFPQRDHMARFSIHQS